MKKTGIWISNKWVAALLLWLGGLTAGNAVTSSRPLAVAKYWHNAKAAVSYTFDDGLEEHYTKVMPHLDSLGIKGTFWIIGKMTDQHRHMRDAALMTWQQIKTLGEHGHEIASHTYGHRNLVKLSKKEIDREIDLNDSVIYSNTGFHPRTLAYPGNSKTDGIVKYVEKHKGIVASRTKQQSLGGTRMSVDGNLDRWLLRCVDSGSWSVSMTHGITVGYDHFPDENVLWRHLRKAKAMQEEGVLWIGTFVEVVSYLRGLSEYVTYILPDKPLTVKQEGKLLTPYRSWDGKWCVDGRRNVRVTVEYDKAEKKISE